MTIISACFVFNWGGVNRLQEEARSISNAKGPCLSCCAHAHQKYFECQSRATMEVIGFKTIDFIALF